MVKLYICGKYLTIALHEEFLAFSNEAKGCGWVFKKTVKCSEYISGDGASIECCSFSPCGKYFGVCYNKNLIIYSTSDWTMLYNSPGTRKGFSLAFFPNSRIVVLADKSGYAGFYSFEGDKLDKKEIGIGHNSMLTGVLISKDEKFVITCDRDEKIRITNYPNVYNIERYCLGHKLFVSHINFLPSDSNILVSSSGDGTLKFWNYLLGKEVTSFSCDNSNECNGNLKATITKFELCKQNNASVLALMTYKSNQIRILKVSGDLNKGLKVELMNILNLKSCPWDIKFSDDQLVCLLPDLSKPLQFWSVGENNLLEVNNDFSNIKQYLNDNWDSLMSRSSKISDDIPVLFKREIDNLQEYETRKKARLLKTGRTS